MKKNNLLKRLCATTLTALLSLSSFSIQNTMAADFLLQGNDFESVYAEWQGAGEYKGYYREVGATEYTAVDSQLIRKDGKGNYRIDVLGLKGNKTYEIKLVPIVNNTEEEANAFTFTQMPGVYDRSGFAHYNFNGGVGAYKNDGTPEANANIIYVSESNKNTVTVEGQKGLSAILKNGGKMSKPLIIRILGKITSPSGVSTGMLSIQNYTKGLTVEGVGTDACLYGWGFNISSNSDLEFRNIKFSWNYEDALGFQKSSRVWVHDNDFTVGNQTPPTESDKSHGDGSCDIKSSDYMTISYNHFIGTAKTSLVGSSPSKVEETGNLTYHHNLFDGTEQRTPRLRWHNAHVYNNYYKNAGYSVDDGSTIGYGIAATCNANIFAENNYFENTYRPMITSAQGNGVTGLSSNNGGVIKAYGNIIDEKCTGYIPGTDYYEATSQKQVLTANDFTAVKGGWTYNNFDTGNSFYTDAYNLDTAEEAKLNAENEAGVLTETTLSSLINDSGNGNGSNTGNDNKDDKDNKDDDNNNNTGDNVETIAAQYYFDFPTSGSISQEFGGEQGNGSFFKSSSSMSCSSTSGEIIIGNKTYNYSGVAGFGNNNTITFTTTDKAIFTVVSTSGSTSGRKMILTNSDGKTISTITSGTSGTAEVSSITIEEPGTYTLTNKGGGEAKLFFIGLQQDDITTTTSDTTTETTTSDTTTESTTSDTTTESTTDTTTETTTEICLIMGDADNDLKITAADSALVLQKVLVNSFIIGIENITKNYIHYVDVTGDNQLNADDAAAILQKVLVNTFEFNSYN